LENPAEIPELFVVIPRLDKLDAVGFDPIDKPMFVVYAPAPATRQFESKWFGLSNADKWIAQNRVHELKDTHRGLAIHLDPIPKIFAKLT
jgi:hypothetical protein